MGARLPHRRLQGLFVHGTCQRKHTERAPGSSMPVAYSPPVKACGGMPAGAAAGAGTALLAPPMGAPLMRDATPAAETLLFVRYEALYSGCSPDTVIHRPRRFPRVRTHGVSDHL